MITKYSKGLTKRICKKVAIGVPFKYAAISCGLSEATFWVYMDKYKEFREAIDKSKSVGLTCLIQEIRLDKSLNAKIWLAERWAPKELHFESQAQQNMEEKILALANEIKQLTETKGDTNGIQSSSSFTIN